MADEANFLSARIWLVVSDENGNLTNQRLTVGKDGALIGKENYFPTSNRLTKNRKRPYMLHCTSTWRSKFYTCRN